VPVDISHILVLAAWTVGLAMVAIWRWRQESTTA
jgi:hypothetical protein